LITNKKYLVSRNEEPPFEAIYLRKERGFYIFLYKNIELPIREQYLKIRKIL